MKWCNILEDRSFIIPADGTPAVDGGGKSGHAPAEDLIRYLDDETIVVKLKSAHQQILLNTTKHRVDEKQLKSMGEVSDLKPSAHGEMKTNLKPASRCIAIIDADVQALVR